MKRSFRVARRLGLGAGLLSACGLAVAAQARATEPALARIEHLEQQLLDLGTRLGDLDAGIQNLVLPDPDSALLFAGTVTVTDLAASALPARADVGLVDSQAWPIEAAAHAEPLATLRLWRPFLSSVDFFTHAKFKLQRGQPLDPAETGYAGEMGFSAVAQLATGEIAAIDAKLELRLRREAADSPWRITEWHTRSFKLVRAAQPLFTDVLDRALPSAEDRSRARTSIHERLVIEHLRNPGARKPHPFFAFHSLNQHPGLAVADVDRDGFDDLYVMERWGANLLLRNRGDGTFEDSAARVGLDLKAHCSSAIFADFDNDGDLDAFVGRTLARSLYLVNEGGTFHDRSATLVSAALPFLVSAVSAADVNADGLLDVYFATYGIDVDLQQTFLPREVSAEIARRLREGGHLFRDRPGPPNVLLLNLGDGRFGPSPHADTAAGWRNTFQATWSDFDQDGDADVYLANDFAPNNLLRNDGMGRFEDVTAATGTADIGFGMGASWGDYDGDGRQDLYVTNMYSTAGRRITEQLGPAASELARMARGNSLLRNEAEGFVHVSGLEPPALLVEKAEWAWGGQFTDVDNDGYLDLYVPNGYYTAPERAGAPPDL